MGVNNMNKEVIYNNDKIIVSNGSGELRELPNTDNATRILELENIIEEIDKKLVFCNYLKGTSNPEEINYARNIFYSLVFTSIPLLCSFLLEKGFNITPEMFNLMIGNMSAPVFLSIAIATVCTIGNIFTVFVGKLKKKESDDIKRGYDCSIKFLQEKKKELELEIQRLQKDQTISVNTPKIGKVTINNPALLKEIEDKEHFVYNAGYHLNEYYKKYLNGTLHFTLDKKGESSKFDDYYDFIEEEGPKLIKNFRHTDMY